VADRSALTLVQMGNASVDGGLKYWDEVILNLAWDPAATGMVHLDKSVEKVQPGKSVQDLITAMKDFPFPYSPRTVVKNRCLLTWVTVK